MREGGATGPSSAVSPIGHAGGEAGRPPLAPTRPLGGQIDPEPQPGGASVAAGTRAASAARMFALPVLPVRVFRRAALVASLAVPLFVLPACSSAGTCAGADDVGACLDELYFSAPESAAKLDDCAAPNGKATPFSPARAQKLALFRGDGIDEDEVAYETRLAQSYYRGYGLTFTTDTDATPYDIEYALAGTKEELENAARIPAGASKEAEGAATRRVADVMLAPMRDFIRGHRSVGVVQVVVLESIASPGVEEINGAGIFAGIGVSPALLDTLESGGTASISELLALGSDFTPTLFLGHADIVEHTVGPAVVAHELGHSLGLPHTTERGNLMTQGQADQKCLPFVDASQLDRIGKNAAAGTGATTKEAATSLRELSSRIVKRVNHLE